MIPRPHRWSISALFNFRTRAKPKSVRTQPVRKPFHAVSIASDRRQACRTARGFGERRFLAREAPTLPLASCDKAACTCRYEHHDDRREDLRRAADEGRAEHPYSGPERRRYQRGRRLRDQRGP
jgi:hypothetical protein